MLDNTSDSYYLKDCILSIRLGSDGFSFSVFNENTMQYEAFRNHTQLKNFEEDFKSAYYKENIFKFQYKKVIISAESDIYMPAPIHFFSTESLFPVFNSSWDINKKSHKNKLETFDLSLFFQTENSIENIINKYFPTGELYHHLFPLCVQNLKQSSLYKKNNTLVFVNIRKENIDISVSRHSSLLLLNTFKTINTNEIVFWIVNVFHQLELDPEKDIVVLFGKTEHEESYTSLLKKYISNVVFASLIEHVSYSEGVHTHTPHSIANFLYLPLCV